MAQLWTGSTEPTKTRRIRTETAFWRSRQPLKDVIRNPRNTAKCGAHTTFREHVISKQFRLYFVSMFTHDSHHVLACDACGTMFVTDEMKARRAENDHHGTVLGALQDVAKKTRAAALGALGGDLGQAAQQTGKAVGDAVDAAQKRVGGLLERLRGKSDE